MKKRKISDAVELLDRWYGGDSEWDRLVAAEELNMQVGQAVHDLRTAAHLTQQQLADATGTTQSIISKVENADYEGSAIEILRRVCFALGRKMSVSCASGDSGTDCRVAVSPG